MTKSSSAYKAENLTVTLFGSRLVILLETQIRRGGWSQTQRTGGCQERGKGGGLGDWN